jgi:hypothetical protein
MPLGASSFVLGAHLSREEVQAWHVYTADRRYLGAAVASAPRAALRNFMALEDDAIREEKVAIRELNQFSVLATYKEREFILERPEREF